jgi:hypothetical protein
MSEPELFIVGGDDRWQPIRKPLDQMTEAEWRYAVGVQCGVVSELQKTADLEDSISGSETQRAYAAEVQDWADAAREKLDRLMMAY